MNNSISTTELDAGYCVHGLNPDVCTVGCSERFERDFYDYEKAERCAASMFDVLLDDAFNALLYVAIDDIKAIGAKYDAQITEQLAGLKG